MIYAIDNFLFMFNMPLKKRIRKKIKRQIETLECLMLTSFEMIMLPPHPDNISMRLYEDPIIKLLCPQTLTSERLVTAGFSAGIIHETAIDYDTEKSCWTINKTAEELLGMFEHDKTLLFVEIPQ